LLANADTCGDAVLVPVAANGSAAFAVYKPAGRGEREAHAIQVLDLSSSAISAIHTFLEPSLFELFDLPRALAEWPREPRSAPTAPNFGGDGRLTLVVADDGSGSGDAE
jgi:hypothetical protein